MCGIVGYVGSTEASGFLLEGLRRLEYRGYDSAGIVTLEEGELVVTKTAGRVEDLAQVLKTNPHSGSIGVGHTRWATHGPATDVNAHPHKDDNQVLALVHNGVIENFASIKQRLVDVGREFVSNTDSEVIAQLISHELEKISDDDQSDADPYTPLIAAVQNSLVQLQGTYGLVVVFKDWPETLIAARLGSPLVLGVGKGENFVASDGFPLAGHTDKIVYLADNEMAVVTADSIRVIHRDEGDVGHDVKLLEIDEAAADLQHYQHYMLKEIFEQPETDPQCYAWPARQRRGHGEVFGGLNLNAQQLQSIRRFVLTACGTSWHACLVGEYHHRILRPRAGGSGIRERVALSQSAPLTGDLAICPDPKRRDARYAGSAAGTQAERLSDDGHLQRRGEHDRPRGRRRHLSACRSRDRRRFHEGLHGAMRGDGVVGVVLRPDSRSQLRGGPADHRRARAIARQGRDCTRDQRRGPKDCRQVRATATTFCTLVASTISPPRWKVR